MFDTPTILSGLALIVSAAIGFLNWRSGRLKPQVDATSMAKDAQTIAKNALDGQVELTKELTDIKKHLKGQYQIKAVVRFYPEPEVLEVTMQLMPASKRGRSIGADQ